MKIFILFNFHGQGPLTVVPGIGVKSEDTMLALRVKIKARRPRTNRSNDAFCRVMIFTFSVPNGY